MEEVKYQINSINTELNNFIDLMKKETVDKEELALSSDEVEKVKHFSEGLEKSYGPLEKKVTNFLEQHNLKVNPEHSFEVRFLTAIEMIRSHTTLSFMLSMLGVAKPMQQLEQNFEQLKNLKRGRRVAAVSEADSDGAV